MKMQQLVLPVLVAITFALSATAADHAHEEKKAGPNGGRLLTALDPHAEFLVTADRRIQITFLDERDQPVAPSDQIVTVTTGERAAPTRLTFTRVGNVLLSEAALPEGNNLPAVVQIKASPEAALVTERFNVNLSTCPECKLVEYACICDH